MQATKRPRVQREPETQANNHAYAPGLCFAAWAGRPCTSDCMSSAGAANKGGTDSCCVDGHCCRLDCRHSTAAGDSTLSKQTCCHHTGQ